MTQASPLHWPAHKPRTRVPQYSNFTTTMAGARDSLMHELRLLGSKDIVLSTNIELRLDGLPYASRRKPDDRGVAVYFTYNGTQMCFACDKWNEVYDNVQGIRKTIEALRGITRWGTGDMMQQAFSGFVALPPPTDHWSMLGINRTNSINEIKLAWRAQAKIYHPDKTTGNADKYQQLNEAYQKAMNEVKS